MNEYNSNTETLQNHGTSQSQLLNDIPITNNNNQISNPQKKNILKGLNKIEEMQLLSIEKNRLKNHISFMIKEETVLPIEIEEKKTNNSAKPKNNVRRQGTDVSHKLTRINSNDKNDFNRKRTIKTPKSKLKNNKESNNTIIKLKESSRSSFRNNSSIITRKRTGSSAFIHPTIIEDFRKKSTLLQNENVKSDDDIKFKRNTGSDYFRRSSDQHNEDYISQFDEACLPKIKFSKNNNSLFNKEKYTWKNTNNEKRLHPQFSWNEDLNQNFIRAQTLGFKNNQGNKLSNNRSGFTFVKDKQNDILSRSKTVAFRHNISEKQKAVELKDLENLHKSPVAIKLDKEKMEDFNLIIEEFRDNININLNSVSNRSSKNKLISGSTDEENETQVKKERNRCLNHKNLVYDSFSDEEDDSENYTNTKFIHPESKFKYTIDLFVAIFSFYIMIITPFILAFYYGYPSKYTEVIFIVELLIDVIFTIDLITSFLVGFHNFEEKLITNNKMIVMNYIYSWMFLDVCCAIPFSTIFSINRIENDKIFQIKIKTTYNATIEELCHFLIVVRYLKLIKTFRVNKFVLSMKQILFDNIKKSATASRLIEFSFYFLLFIHLLACIFIKLGKLDIPNWIRKCNLEDSVATEIYIASVYFILSTIASVGYGDISTNNIYERIYNVFLLMVGLMIYSYGVSSLSNIILDEDNKKKEISNKFDYLETLGIKYSLPSSLMKKISRFLKYNINVNKSDKNIILDLLPNSLKNEVILNIHRPIIKNFIFFKNFDNVDFITRAIIALKPISAEKNERIVKEGDFIEEITFIKRGALVLEIGINIVNDALEPKNSINSKKSLKPFGSLKTGNVFSNTVIEMNEGLQEKVNNLSQNKLQFMEKHYLKIIELRRNEHYGDVLMFLNRRSPLNVRVKTKIAELYIMKKTDVVNISMTYPEIFEKITRKSAFNQEQIDLLIKRTKLLFYENHRDEFITLTTKKSGPRSRSMYFTNFYKDDLKYLDNPRKIVLNSIPSERSSKLTNIIAEEQDTNEENNSGSPITMKLGKGYKGKMTISEKAYEEEESNFIDEQQLFNPFSIERTNKKIKKTRSTNILAKHIHKTNTAIGEIQKSKTLNESKAVSFSNKLDMIPLLYSEPTLEEVKYFPNQNKYHSIKNVKNEISEENSLREESFNIEDTYAINEEVQSQEDKVRVVNKNIIPCLIPKNTILSASLITSEKKLVKESNIPRQRNSFQHSLKESNIPRQRNSFQHSLKEKSIKYPKPSDSFDNHHYEGYSSENIFTKKKEVPILYNLNINNNYNFEKPSKNETDCFECPKCKTNSIPISVNRLLVLENGKIKDNMSIIWKNLQINTSVSFSYSSLKKTNIINQNISIQKQNTIFNVNRRISINEEEGIERINSFSSHDFRVNSMKTKQTNFDFSKKFSRNNDEYDSSFSKKRTKKRRESTISQFNNLKETYFDSTKMTNVLNNKNNLYRGISVINNFKSLDPEIKLRGSYNEIPPKETKSPPNKIKIKTGDTYSQIFKNIEENALNLNDPKYFYSELFQQVLNKKQSVKQKKHKLIDTEKLNKRLDKLEKMLFLNTTKTR